MAASPDGSRTSDSTQLTDLNNHKWTLIGGGPTRDGKYTSGSAYVIEIAQGGNVFITNGGNWYEWNESTQHWDNTNSTADPNGVTPPPPPPPPSGNPPTGVPKLDVTLTYPDGTVWKGTAQPAQVGA